MGAICVSASINHLTKYSLLSFSLLLWQNSGLKQCKVLVPYIMSYFHVIRFLVDHVWTIRGPSFSNLKDKKGALGDTAWPRGLPLWELYVFLLQEII